MVSAKGDYRSEVNNVKRVIQNRIWRPLRKGVICMSPISIFAKA